MAFEDAVARTEERAAVDEVAIPLVAEQLVVDKRVVETGRVRLQVHTEEHVEVVEAPLMQVQYAVEHVPVDRVVDAVPAIRYEGETTVYPVMAERLVVRREMVLVEEVRVTRREVRTVETQSHVLRREEMTEERMAVGGEGVSAKQHS